MGARLRERTSVEERSGWPRVGLAVRDDLDPRGRECFCLGGDRLATDELSHPSVALSIYGGEVALRVL